MSSIIMQDVSLDYLVKTGSDSIKRSALLALNRCLRRSKARKIAIRNSSYRALNNISLAIHKGDRVGILGRNGAGKSTLLRVLAKVYAPSSGTLTINGKISSLFDVNLGMNPEATGYENILNLAIMRGASKKEARNLIASVEAFTELGAFLDQPVRTYSTGMQMKLAFAVATSRTAEILLIDEIIGAGDAHFIEKATRRLEANIEKSHILVLTSHSNEIVRRFCNKALVLEQGQLKFYGDVNEAIHTYQNLGNDLESGASAPSTVHALQEA